MTLQYKQATNYCLSIVYIFFNLKTLKYKYICKHVTNMASYSCRGIFDIVPVLAIHNRHRELFSQTVFQNSSSSTRESAPAQDPEPELFLEELEPYQTGPKWDAEPRERASAVGFPDQ